MFWYRDKRKMDTRKVHFDRMMRIGTSIFKEANKHEIHAGYTHPILNYIKLLGLKLQTDYMTNLLYADDHGTVKKYPDITPDLVFLELLHIVTPSGESVHELLHKKELDRRIEVDLVKDLILPWPWEVSRLVGTISSIGPSRPWGEWEEYSNNHNVVVFLPMGVCFVIGGNHSITSGILYGEGKLTAKHVYDLSELYDFIYTDGVHYYRKRGNTVLSDVCHVEFAAIFEIGRKMAELGISR